MIRGERRVFPVGLYATLLAALCCLAAPQVVHSVETRIRGLQCLPLRAWTALEGWFAKTPLAPVDVARAKAALWRRQRASLLLAGRRLVPAGLEGVVCRVIERRDRGGSGLPAVLLLDRQASSLAGAATFVTSGDRLLGFLDPNAGPHEPARVLLLHSLGGRRVPAVVDVVTGRSLRLLVEPAGRRDEWPLHCRLFEDPYLVARLTRSGQIVRTTNLSGDEGGSVPAGLRIGRLRVLGYRRDGRVLVVDLFVEPAIEPRAISSVVVWRPRAAPGGRRPPPVARASARAVRMLRLPAPGRARERWFLAVRSGLVLRSGAALLRGGRLVGRVVEGGRGFALAAPFGERRRPWSLLLVPGDRSHPVVELLARPVRRVDADVELRTTGLAAPSRLPAGELFTGANGPDCPAGLAIGEVVGPPTDPRTLLVHMTAPRDGVLRVYRQGRGGGR